jgi:hypothetical protein
MNIASFVNVLREEDLLYWFTSFVQDNLGDRLPDNNPFDEIDENITTAELVRLIRCFVNYDGDTAIDDQVVDEIADINRLYDSASSIFHCELERFDADVDMGDELSDIFVPLLFDRFDRLMSN